MIKNKYTSRLLISLLGKIKCLFIKNIVIILILLSLAIYLYIKNGLDYTINAIAIILGLLIPLFIPIYLFNIVKFALSRKKIETEKVITVFTLIFISIIVYALGLHEKQRIFLYVYNGILSSFILIIMFVRSML